MTPGQQDGLLHMGQWRWPGPLGTGEPSIWACPGDCIVMTSRAGALLRALCTGEPSLPFVLSPTLHPMACDASKPCPSPACLLTHKVGVVRSRARPSGSLGNK